MPEVGTTDADGPGKGWFTQAWTQCHSPTPHYRAYSPRAERGPKSQGPPPPAAVWALQGEHTPSVTALLVPGSPLPRLHGTGWAQWGLSPRAPQLLTAGVGDPQLFLHAREARVPKGGLVSCHGAVPLAVALLGDPPQGVRSQALCKVMGHEPAGRPARRAPASPPEAQGQRNSSMAPALCFQHGSWPQFWLTPLRRTYMGSPSVQGITLRFAPQESPIICRINGQDGFWPALQPQLVILAHGLDPMVPWGVTPWVVPTHPE